ENETGRVAGFANGGPNREGAAGYEGELYAIYVLKEHVGRGMGRALALAVARRLERLGMRSMVLWVLEENTPARRFYESLGGQLGGERDLEIGGLTLKEVASMWDDITKVGERRQ